MEDKKYIKLEGIIALPSTITNDDFTNQFIDFVEGLKGEFGGGTIEVDSNGDAIGQ